MAVRHVEGELPYTGGNAIEVTANKVINLILREENNLLKVNDDNELYCDLQLDSGITPSSNFPVGITVGRVLQEDGWYKTGTALIYKTTSGDYNIWLYGNDNKIYFLDGNNSWHRVYYSDEVDALIDNLQDQIDALDGRLDTAETNIQTNASDIAALETNLSSNYYTKTQIDAQQLKFYWETVPAGSSSYTLSHTPVSSTSLQIYTDSGTALFPIVDYSISGKVISFSSLESTESAYVWVISRD